MKQFAVMDFKPLKPEITERGQQTLISSPQFYIVSQPSLETRFTLKVNTQVDSLLIQLQIHRVKFPMIAVYSLLSALCSLSGSPQQIPRNHCIHVQYSDSSQ